MTTATEPLVLVEYLERYAVLTLNRPAKHNAMSWRAQAQLRAALDDIRAAGSRVVVLTGAGRSFCAGVDLKDHTDPDARVTAHESNGWAVTQRHIAAHPAVFVAAVNGPALGGGLTLVHNAELAIAADTATFGMPEITFGVYPALAGPATTRRILPKHTAWLTFTGERIDAATALSWGVVNEVVPAERLRERAEELAAHIARFDPVSLDHAKQAYRAVQSLDWDAGIDHGMAANARIAVARGVTGEPAS